jgi:hypothetical protein
VVIRTFSQPVVRAVVTVCPGLLHTFVSLSRVSFIVAPFLTGRALGYGSGVSASAGSGGAAASCWIRASSSSASLRRVSAQQ